MNKVNKNKQVEKPVKKNKGFGWSRSLDIVIGGLGLVALMALSAYGLRKLFEAMPDQLNVVLTIGVSVLLLYAVIRFIAAIKK